MTDSIKEIQLWPVLYTRQQCTILTPSNRANLELPNEILVLIFEQLEKYQDALNILLQQNTLCPVSAISLRRYLGRLQPTAQARTLAPRLS